MTRRRIQSSPSLQVGDEAVRGKSHAFAKFLDRVRHLEIHAKGHAQQDAQFRDAPGSLRRRRATPHEFGALAFSSRYGSANMRMSSPCVLAGICASTVQDESARALAFPSSAVCFTSVMTISPRPILRFSSHRFCFLDTSRVRQGADRRALPLPCPSRLRRAPVPIARFRLKNELGIAELPHFRNIETRQFRFG